jgi:hypothetical protein
MIDAAILVRGLGKRFGSVTAAHTQLRDLPAEVGAIFLPHTRPEFAYAARALADGPPVLTSQDTTAIALTAAVLTTLTRAGRAPRSSRVVIAGANTICTPHRHKDSSTARSTISSPSRCSPTTSAVATPPPTSPSSHPTPDA